MIERRFIQIEDWKRQQKHRENHEEQNELELEAEAINKLEVLREQIYDSVVNAVEDADECGVKMCESVAAIEVGMNLLHQWLSLTSLVRRPFYLFLIDSFYKKTY